VGCDNGPSLGDKILTDTDLNPIRKKPIGYKLSIFCPGHGGPDIFYEFGSDGGVIYYATEPDTVGEGRKKPDKVLSGWYTIIGDSVFVSVPGKDVSWFIADLDPIGRVGGIKSEPRYMGQ